MAAELGGSQISALLESVPGIANVLRSPVADAIVNLIRSGAGLHPFAVRDAEELVQFAIRRGLINAAEGDQVLAEVRAGKKGRPKPAAKPKSRSAKKPAAKAPAKRHVATRPVAKKSATKNTAAKKTTKKAVKTTAKKPAKKAGKKSAAKRPARRARR